MLLSEFKTTGVTKRNLQDFIQACCSELNFHPDTDFSDYISMDGAKCFEDEDCKTYNQRLSAAFEVCKEESIDIYSLTLKITLQLWD